MGCGCGTFKSVNGFGASPDGLGQYDVSRAGDFGASPDGLGTFFAADVGCSQNKWARIALCAVTGAALGGLGGVAVGYKQGKVAKGAAIGGAVGAAAYALLCHLMPCDVAPVSTIVNVPVPAALPPPPPALTCPPCAKCATCAPCAKCAPCPKPEPRSTAQSNWSEAPAVDDTQHIPSIRGFGAYYTT
jgi:hypothetical protein